MISLLRSARSLAARGTADVPFWLRSVATHADGVWPAAFILPPIPSSTTGTSPILSQALTPPQICISSLMGFHALLPETAQALKQLSLNNSNAAVASLSEAAAFFNSNSFNNNITLPDMDRHIEILEQPVVGEETINNGGTLPLTWHCIQAHIST
ncbi:hypothetical protein Ndes2526B_g06037 [Nannochloris sp. 'desiccata']